MANTDYCFISWEVASCRLSSDSKLFKNWAFRKLLEINKPNIPDPRVVTSDVEELSMPFVFLSDEAFALSELMLRQYPNKF